MIVVKNLWKRYSSLQVLRGLNLDIHEGETLVILGRSGVGKSVLLKHIIGLETPDKGSVEIAGKNLSTLEPLERLQILKKMGMLFQGAALFDSMNIFENTAFSLRQHGHLNTGKRLPEPEIRRRVLHALEMVDLHGVYKKMPSDLSGGMRKRAALARLIVYRPTILLYDEPTTGLDPITAMQINHLILETQKELKATSIVVTHDLVSAMTVANRIALHSEGRIAHIAPKDEFRRVNDPLVNSFFENANPQGSHG